MATEPKNASEDTEMADCDGEKVVTMMDVLQEQEDFEEDANAVLGASDEKDCTYSKGYIKRQALYACMTCCPDAKNDPNKRAGVCLACSLTCHENHDLIELYTKRNFKCDCGNPKFNSHPCQFTPDKTDLNEDNKYNQNFSGLYCVCQRPYPDPESDTEVEMIQCIICEDWLHASHLEATVPDNDQYSEMICKGCMEKNEFLHDYGNLAVNSDVDVVTNGIDNDKMCNGDVKVDTLDKDETVKATDNIEMTEKASDNITDENSEKNLNGDDSKESSDEKKDDDSVKMSMETEESKELVANTTPEASTDNATKDTEVDEGTNENKESVTETKEAESAAEIENTESVPKSAEQLEEEQLLADPDDDSKKSKAEENGEGKENSELPQAEDNKTNETVTETSDENVAAEPDEPISDDKQNESKNDEDSTETVSEKQVDENSVEKETNSSDEDKNVTPEVDMEENACNIQKENDPVELKEVSQNGDTEAKICEKRKLSTEDNTGSDIKKAKLEETSECVRPKGVKKVHRGATFWPSTFRQKLCTCRECITMYKDLSVLFLIDPEDTVSAYENLGKQKINGKPASQYEKGLQALSSLDRIQQINALTEYNKMRDKLLDFLKSFKDRREVVKEEDIKAFFAGMKPKREPDGVYFCR